jgi:hypothetical protein
MLAALHVGRLAERDDRHAAALAALGVDAGVVIALVERARLGGEAARAHRIQQPRDEGGLMLACRGDGPRDGKIGGGADRGVDRVAVEPAALPRADGAAMTPACVRVAVALALRERRRRTAFTDLAPVRAGRSGGRFLQIRGGRATGRAAAPRHHPELAHRLAPRQIDWGCACLPCATGRPVQEAVGLKDPRERRDERHRRDRATVVCSVGVQAPRARRPGQMLGYDDLEVARRSDYHDAGCARGRGPSS